MTSNRTFRAPKSTAEEIEILENSVTKSTHSVNKWVMKIFGEWQLGRRKKKACEEQSGSLIETSLQCSITVRSIEYRNSLCCTILVSPNKLFVN